MGAYDSTSRTMLANGQDVSVADFRDFRADIILDTVAKAGQPNYLAGLDADGHLPAAQGTSGALYPVRCQGAADHTAAIQAAINTHRHVLLSGTANISAPLLLPADSSLTGTALVKLAAGFNGLGAVMPTGPRTTVGMGLTLDGSLVTSATVSGVVLMAAGLQRVTIERLGIQHMPFDGIAVYDSNGSWPVSDLAIRGCWISDVGWVGVNLQGVTRCDLTGTTILTTGFAGIEIDPRCYDVLIDANRVDKSLIPSRVYNGPGGVGGQMSGALVSIAVDSKRVRITNNLLNDNSRAIPAHDGIELGEDGSGTADGVVISGNYVGFTSGFGIDATNNCIITGNIIDHALKEAVVVGLDLGGAVRNVQISGNIIIDTGDAAGPELAAVRVGNPASPNTITSVRVTENLVVDDRGGAARRNTYLVSIGGNANTLTGIIVENNEAPTVAHTGAQFGSGGSWQVSCRDNRTGGFEPVGVNFSAMFADAFQVASPSSAVLDHITGGFEGKRICVQFVDGNTTVKPSVGAGNGLMGNQGAQFTPAAYDILDCVFRGSVWYFTWIRR